MSNTVIYHKSDFDGIFCREIARKFLPPNTVLLGYEYGDGKPVIPPDDTLFMLDINVPELMTYTKLVWIDHHKSAIDKFPATIPGYRIDGVAACRLAWQWFDIQQRWGGAVWPETPELPKKEAYIDRTVPEPLAVRLAGEYDIWDRRDPRAELLQHGLRAQELSGNLWDLLLVLWEPEADGRKDAGAIAVEALLERGEVLQYAKTEENTSIIKAFGFNVDFEGLKFLACNHARFNSHLFTAAIRPEHDGLLGFNWTGKLWRISLYHAPGKEHHDLSKIAVKYGGGGHRGACGMTLKALPFAL